MYGILRWVLVKQPGPAFGEADPGEWHYSSVPNLKVARQEHDDFVSIVRDAGVKVAYHDEPQPGRADAIYVYDPALLTDEGAVILQMGKGQRRGEEAAMARRLESLGIPVLGTLWGEACAEGGDLLWVDQNTLAVGLGFRTNLEGLRQLEGFLKPLGVTVLPVELPYYAGADACLHLMSLISIVAPKLAVVYPPLLSVPFWQQLRSRGFMLVEVPDDEFGTMGTNVLALAPAKCVMLEGNPVTQRRLEAAGCSVQIYVGNEISLKAEGGPTCLTRPLLRR